MEKNKLLNKIGSMVPLNYVPKPGEHVIHAYLWGEVPVAFVSTSITQEEFNKIC